MVKIKGVWLVSQFLLITVLVFNSCSNGSNKKNMREADSDSLSARITRVENGLLSSIVIAGDARLERGFNISDRLLTHQVPSVSLAVIHDGVLEWAKAYGVRSTDTDLPADKRTLFQAASISKPVTALAALALVEEGRLSLDEDVDTWLKSWRIPDNEYTATEKITLARLLSHRAGLSPGGYDGYETGEETPTLPQILNGQKPANSPAVTVVAEPGTECVYSGAAYTIVQQLIIDVTDDDFADVLRRTVFDPIGMKNSYFLQPLTGRLTGNAASGHHEDLTVYDDGCRLYPELAAAGLWTTPTDLALFMTEVLATSKGLSEKAVSRTMASAMLTRRQGQYGLGLAVIEKEDRVLVGHSGMNRGFRCKMVMYTGSGDGIVVMTNSENGDRIISELIRSVSREYDWPGYKPVIKHVVSVDKDVLAGLAGKYAHNDFIHYELTLVDGRLLYGFRAEAEKPLYARSPDEYFTLDGEKVIILRDEQGAVTGIEASNYRGTFKADRSAP